MLALQALALGAVVVVAACYLCRSHRTTVPLMAVIVLGDLGHLPRMCYHARLLANSRHYQVELCGYVEELPPVDLITSPLVRLHRICPIRNTWGLPYVAFAPLKAVLMAWELVCLLFRFGGTQGVLLQNPPSVPILALCIAYKAVRGGRWRVVVDWHNLNYTILNLRFQNLNHPLVRAMRWYERFFARFADDHLVVTKQLKLFLVNDFGIPEGVVTVVYDRPGAQFQPLGLGETGQHGNTGVFKAAAGSPIKLLKEIPAFADLELPNADRWNVVATSTSYTPDEDLWALLEALKLYQARMAKRPDLPPLLLVVTGKGPLKTKFEAAVAAAQFPSSDIQVRCVWLSADDYPRVLQLVHIGVSLHTLLLGIDLPMKILDFFGCGVPVIAVGFKAIAELVTDGVNGVVVDGTAESLEEAVEKCVMDRVFYGRLRVGAGRESDNRWEQNWMRLLECVF